ncbi:MAG: cobalamin-dependent protein [Acutalibacteraceae bacterium]
MKTLFVAINAKYIHTNLAVRYMHELAKQNGYTSTEIAEYTINQRLPQLLRELYLTKANHMIFSCYIWNIDIILDLCCQLKQVMPNIKLLLAGPEVSYNSTEIMEQYTFIDGIIRGEGEAALIPLLKHLQSGTPAASVPSFTYRIGQHIAETEQASPISLSQLPFPYPDLEKEKGRILYFECSRGCPFQCGYCLSSIEKGVRFMPLEQVYQCLDLFLSKDVPQVKFVDRTFNCNKAYAFSIWNYLKEHDNGITNFHFEIAGELLDQETISFLSTVRKEQFQFEVGVQSTNTETLSAITRKTDTNKLLQICKEIDSFGIYTFI